MSFSINLIKHETPAHKHNNYEIIVYTNGKGTIRAGEKTIDVEAGNMVIIPPGTIHETFHTDLDFERIYINGEFHQIFFFTSPTFILDNSEKEGSMLAKMIYANRYSNQEYVTTLINAFAHFLLQNIKMEDSIFLATKSIVEEISNNFHDSDIDLNALLNGSGYAEDYIRAQFKKIMRKTPTEFLTEVRISHACYLIDTYGNLLSLANVAERCGYSDYVYFSRRFKQIMGVSPQKYMAGI